MVADFTLTNIAAHFNGDKPFIFLNVIFTVLNINHFGQCNLIIPAVINLQQRAK